MLDRFCSSKKASSLTSLHPDGLSTHAPARHADSTVVDEGVIVGLTVALGEQRDPALSKEILEVFGVDSVVFGLVDQGSELLDEKRRLESRDVMGLLLPCFAHDPILPSVDGFVHTVRDLILIPNCSAIRRSPSLRYRRLNVPSLFR